MAVDMQFTMARDNGAAKLHLGLIAGVANRAHHPKNRYLTSTNTRSRAMRILLFISITIVLSSCYANSEVSYIDEVIGDDQTHYIPLAEDESWLNDLSESQRTEEIFHEMEVVSQVIKSFREKEPARAIETEVNRLILENIDRPNYGRMAEQLHSYALQAWLKDPNPDFETLGRHVRALADLRHPDVRYVTQALLALREQWPEDDIARYARHFQQVAQTTNMNKDCAEGACIEAQLQMLNNLTKDQSDARNTFMIEQLKSMQSINSM